MPQEITAYIALGSNLGDREGFIRDALWALDEIEGVRVAKVSSLLENPAVGGPPDSPPFLNAAAELRTTLGPHELLRQMLRIEQSLSRQRSEKSAPRTIDLDLLLYGNEVIETQELRIPHPRMKEREFVLKPLAEIAPHVKL